MKRFGQIFVTIVALLSLLPAAARGDTWTTNKRLTNNVGDSYNPAIVVDGSSIYMFWEDYTPGNFEIYFKKSDDGGTTWTKNKRLTWNAGDSYNPAIVVDGSSIYLVWNDNTPGNLEIYFKKSDDGGTTWTKNKRLTWNADDSYLPAITVNSSGIYMTWEDYTAGNFEIYFKKSDDGGTTWTKNKRLTWNAGDSEYPAIATDGSSIYMTWEDYTAGDFEIYFKKSDDGGTTWTKNKRLTWNAGDSEYPAIATDGSSIYVTWEDYTAGNFEIYFKKSDDGGTTWTKNKRLTWNAGDSFWPAIAADGSSIYVVWCDNTPENYEIYFKKGILF
jgi:hypothetical protein